MDSSHSNSASSDELYTSGPPRCYCGKPTLVLKSWTVDNPGRRFVCCETHGFFNWVDPKPKPPHGWQKDALLEEISNLKKENKRLKESAGCSTNVGTKMMDKLEAENAVVDTSDETKMVEKLETENAVMKERETSMRQFLVISWAGFAVVTTIIIAMMK